MENQDSKKTIKNFLKNNHFYATLSLKNIFSSTGMFKCIGEKDTYTSSPKYLNSVFTTLSYSVFNTKNKMLNKLNKSKEEKNGRI